MTRRIKNAGHSHCTPTSLPSFFRLMVWMQSRPPLARKGQVWVVNSNRCAPPLPFTGPAGYARREADCTSVPHSTINNFFTRCCHACQHERVGAQNYHEQREHFMSRDSHTQTQTHPQPAWVVSAQRACSSLAFSSRKLHSDANCLRFTGSNIIDWLNLTQCECSFLTDSVK